MVMNPPLPSLCIICIVTLQARLDVFDIFQ